MKENTNMQDVEFQEFISRIKANDTIEIYTDGSCRGNPGLGGWGAVFVFRELRTNLSGFEKHTTNNRMELKAAIESLKNIPNNINIDLYTDSSYVKNGITIWINNWQKNNWKSSSGKDVKNQDLWMELNQVIKDKNVLWHWVKGHADCLNNNNADYIAKSAIVTSYMQEEGNNV